MIVVVCLRCMQIIDDSSYLLGDKLTENKRRKQFRESNVSFAQMFSPDYASNLKTHWIFLDKALQNIQEKKSCLYTKALGIYLPNCELSEL